MDASASVQPVLDLYHLHETIQARQYVQCRIPATAMQYSLKVYGQCAQGMYALWNSN